MNSSGYWMLDAGYSEFGISQQADPPTGVTRKWELIEERNEKRWHSIIK
jgi:hypothetical protein